MRSNAIVSFSLCASRRSCVSHDTLQGEPISARSRATEIPFGCGSLFLLRGAEIRLQKADRCPCSALAVSSAGRASASQSLVSSWGQNLSPNHALACGSHTLGVKFPCLCPSHPHMSAGWDGDCKFSLLPWVPRAFRPFCRG